MTLAEAVLAVLLAESPWYEDQKEVGRVERLTSVAIGITYAAHHTPTWKRSPVELAAFLEMEGAWESRYNSRVHAGECGKDECDPQKHGGRIVHTSITPWQLKQNSMTRTDWLAMVGVGVEPTVLAASEAARRAAVGLRMCRTIEGAINVYATGKCTGHAQTPMRLASYERVLRRLRRDMKQ